MTQEEMYEHITSCYPDVDKEKLKEVLTSKTPYLTIAMISWLRPDKLVKNLKNILETTVIPINICLHVQGSEQLRDKFKEQIISLAFKFNDTNLKFSKRNLGTGIPRHGRVVEALKYNTPYIQTLDDDTIIPAGGTEALITLLESDKLLGAASLVCNPKRNIYDLVEVKGEKGLQHRLAQAKEGSLDFGDAVGSATQVVRREVYDTCMLDSKYRIGCADFDFSMQMRQEGWKLAMICVEEFAAENLNRDNSEEYEKGRRHMQTIQASCNRFYKKWGINMGLGIEV